jgi:hypothetical protein
MAERRSEVGVNVEIKRTRWIMTRNNGREIFCGLARHYCFKEISGIGRTAIKTYESEAKAIAALERSWGNYQEDYYKAVEVTEIIAINGERRESEG